MAGSTKASQKIPNRSANSGSAVKGGGFAGAVELRWLKLDRVGC
jgi:hypothetical protein